MTPPPLPDRDTRLTAETFVRRVVLFAETDSTNVRAVEAAGELGSESLPALFLAERQTAGRGRGANRWWSSEGSLTFSLLLEPARLGVDVAQWPALSLTVGSAVAEAIARFVPQADVRLKWPNDVYVNDRKVCGVLNESPPAAPQRLVVGIGINVNTPLDQAPAEVAGRLTSLATVAGMSLDREDVLVEVLQQLERDFASLAGRDRNLTDRWRRQCLLTGRTLVVSVGSRETAGTCLGIDDDGALRIQTASSVERLYSGVVQEFR